MSWQSTGREPGSDYTDPGTEASGPKFVLHRSSYKSFSPARKPVSLLFPILFPLRQHRNKTSVRSLPISQRGITDLNREPAGTSRPGPQTPRAAPKTPSCFPYTTPGGEPQADPACVASSSRPWPAVPPVREYLKFKARVGHGLLMRLQRAGPRRPRAAERRPRRWRREGRGGLTRTQGA